MSRLIRWAPTLAASADDLLNFGPQAARVRALLSFLPNMSEEAKFATEVFATNAEDAAKANNYILLDALTEGAEGGGKQGLNAWRAGRDAGRVTRPRFESVARAAGDAAQAEAASALIPAELYQNMVAPVASGRAYDILRPRTNDNFLRVIRDLSGRGLMLQPLDVLAASRYANAPKSEQEMLMEVINAIAGDTGYADTGYGSLAEIIDAARRLG